MPPKVDFQALMSELGRHQQSMAEVYAKAPPSPERELLGQLLDKIKVARGNAEQAYPQATAQLQKSIASTQAGIVTAQQELDRNQAALKSATEAAGQASPPKPAKAEVEFDPALGEQLRNELLQLYTPQAAPLPSDEPSSRAIWQDWAGWDR